MSLIFFLISCSYNKTEEDFPTLSDYNDYLEEVECISKLAIFLTELIQFVTNNIH